jgi:hypothetical protein
MQRSTLSRLVLLQDGEPALLDLSVHDGVSRDNDGTDVLSEGVILVSVF